MYCSRFLVWTLFAAAGYSWTYDWPSSGDTQWLDGNMQQVIGVSCTTSHLTAFQMFKTKDPIFFSTSCTDHFVSPKMLPLNGTAGEQWEFDGVSNDGMRLLCLVSTATPIMPFSVQETCVSAWKWRL